MSATCAITDITGQWGETSVPAPRAAVEPSAPSYADRAVASPVDGADLLQFLRVAYAPPQTEAEKAAQLSSDLVKFLRDFGSTAPRPMGSGMPGGEYQVRLVVSSVLGPVRKELDRYGINAALGPGAYYETPGEALEAFHAAPPSPA